MENGRASAGYSISPFVSNTSVQDVPQENDPMRLSLVSLIKVIVDAFQAMSSRQF